MKAPLPWVSWQLFSYYCSWSFLQALHFTCPLKIWCLYRLSSCVSIYSPGGDWTYFCPSNSLSSSLSHCYRDQSHSRAAQHHLTCLASWPGAPDMPQTVGILPRADTCSPENQRVTHSKTLIEMVDQVSRINASLLLLTFPEVSWAGVQSLKLRPFPYYWIYM